MSVRNVWYCEASIHCDTEATWVRPSGQPAKRFFCDEHRAMLCSGFGVPASEFVLVEDYIADVIEASTARPRTVLEEYKRDEENR